MANIQEKILGKYGINIDQENIFKLYKIESSEISPQELEEKIAGTRKRWNQSVNGTNEKNAERDRVRLEKADKYEAILRDEKLRKEVFIYYTQSGEQKNRGGGPAGGTEFAREYFKLVGTSKKIRKVDVDFFFDYYQAERKNKKAILEMLEKDFKIKMFGKEDKYADENADIDPDGKKKDGSSPVIVNLFQKATIMKLRKCFEFRDQALKSSDVCQRYPNLHHDLYSFLGLKEIESNQQFSDLISARREEAHKIQQDKAEQGKGSEYKPLVDLFNNLQVLSSHQDVVDNLPEFKLLIQYPSLTPYMFAFVEMRPDTLDGIFDVANRNYNFRDKDDFILNYYKPVHSNFGISNNGINSILKKAEKKAKTNKVLNKIDEKLGRKKDRKIPLGMELIHWLAYWPIFTVYLIFEIFKGIFTQLHRLLIPIFLLLFVGGNWWLPKKFEIDNLLVLRKIFIKAEWYAYVEDYELGVTIGSLIVIITMLAIYVIPPLFVVLFLHETLKDLNKRYDWIGYQRTFRNILNHLRQKTEEQYTAQKKLFFKKNVPKAILNIVCLAILAAAIYFTPVGFRALSETTGYFQSEKTSDQNVQISAEKNSDDLTSEELETHYATSLSEIGGDTLNAMKQQAEDVYTAKWYKLEGSMDGLEGLTYVGNYFLSKKDGALGDENCIYLVYRVDAEFEGEIYPHYHFIQFSNIMVRGDGSCTVNLNNHKTATHKYNIDPPKGYIEVYYYGYETLDEMYEDCILPQIETYTFEDNVTE